MNAYWTIIGQTIYTLSLPKKWFKRNIPNIQLDEKEARYQNKQTIQHVAHCHGDRGRNRKYTCTQEYVHGKILEDTQETGHPYLYPLGMGLGVLRLVRQSLFVI